jgi:hypothetical protein
MAGIHFGRCTPSIYPPASVSKLDKVELRTCGVNHASRRTSKRSITVQIHASALATVFS